MQFHIPCFGRKLNTFIKFFNAYDTISSLQPHFLKRNNPKKERDLTSWKSHVNLNLSSTQRHDATLKINQYLISFPPLA